MRGKAAKNQRALHVVQDDAQEGSKKRPLRSTCLPEAPGKEPALFDFALERDGNRPRHLQVITDVERLMDTDAFDAIMKPALDIAEHRRVSPRPGEKGKRNTPGPYPVHELWLLEAAHYAMGFKDFKTHKAFYTWLTSSFGLPFCRHFGFANERDRSCGRVPVEGRGIPSEGTIGRYRNDWFVEAERRVAWMAFERALQYEVIDVDPDGCRREAEALLADGSVKETHHTVPIYRKLKKGERKRPLGERPINEFRLDRVTGLKNIPAITCPEGGHIAGGSDHAGDGFNVIFVMDQGANVPSWRVEALSDAENTSLYNQRDEIDAYLRHVGTDISVLTTDTAFHTKAEQGMPRGAWHDRRIIENIQFSSHGDSETTLASAAKRRKKKYVISWNQKFWLDGHRQGHCEHGKCKVVRRVDERKRGNGITVRTEYVCPSNDEAQQCGSVTLTAGRYRIAGNNAGTESVVKARADEKDKVDWTIGNFMTYDDAEYAKHFGMLRRSLQEGFFGSQLTNRLGTLEKRFIRRKAQAELDIAISLSILHAAKLAHRRTRLNKPRQAPAAPALLAAA